MILEDPSQLGIFIRRYQRYVFAISVLYILGLSCHIL